MIVAIHQPNYIPWLGFFHKMANSDIFVLLDDVKHSKSSITHRNKIKAFDKELLLSVPLKNKESLINELLIHDPLLSLKKHWQAIDTNYRRAKYWEYVSDELKKIYNSEWKYLVDLNISIIKLIKNKLNIDCKILIASEIGNIEGEGSTRNLNICKILNADTYLSGTGASAYNDESSFKENNIQLAYDKFKHPVYPQIGAFFIQNLSILDLLFNCGKDSIDYVKK